MTWTSPSTVATGDTITASLWNTYVRDNSNHLRGMLPDPGAAGLLPYSNSSTTATWAALLTILGYTPLNKAGDTASSTIKAPSFELTSGNDRWQWIASGASMFIGIPSLVNPIELTSSAVKLTGTTTVNGSAVLTGASTDKVPSGLGGYFATAAGIASGWTRDSALDGRIPVGAGTTFSTTFVEATNYGASWSHGGDAISLAFSVTSGTPSGGGAVQGGGGVNLDGHTHGVSGNATGVTPSSTWVLPSRGVVWATKN